MENTDMSNDRNENVAVWFEIPAFNFERAVGFYEQIFDTTLVRDKFGPSDLAVFPHADTAMSGCIMKGEGYTPVSGGTVVYLSSKVDLDVPLGRVKKAGGYIATPKTA